MGNSLTLYGDNIGFAAACNTLARYASADILLLLNPDAYLQEFSMSELSERVGPGVLANALIEIPGAASMNARQGVACDLWLTPRDCFDINDAAYVDGSALFIDRETFTFLAGFDENYFLFYEDTDLSLRALLSGYQLQILSQWTVSHESGGGIEGGAKRALGPHFTGPLRRRLSEANVLRTGIKIWSWWTLLWWLPTLLAQQALTALAFAATGQFRLAGATLGAWFDVTQSLRSTCVSRRGAQGGRKVRDSQILRRLRRSPVRLEMLKSSGVPRAGS